MQSMTRLAAVAICTALAAGCAATGASNGSAGTHDKVIYHINESTDQGADGLRNANNHLSTDPDAKIVFVTHARGVDFLMKGARDKKGNLFEPMVDNLKLKGVRFEICEITLQNRQLRKEQFIDSATYVPSGVATLTRLQQRDGFAYVKP